jgi:hypothetical protein
MTIKTILAAAVSISFAAFPVLAQSSSNTEKNGHIYSGGQKTEVPHHMGKKKEANAPKTKSTGGHHYSGGPRAEPHHMGEKQ